jgi:uncharacterized protein (TIRG00374 family)
MKTDSAQDNQTIKIPKFALFVGVFVLVALVIFVIIHFTEAERFAILLSQAEPKWLFLAVLLQIGTYFCAGLIWNLVIRYANYRVSTGALARLSVEKLSVDQLVPTGGIAGNIVVFHTMRRLGLPHWLAMEALLIDILSHYIAYAVVTFAAFSVLWFYHDITAVIRYLLGIFTTILIIVPSAILWLLSHKDRRLPSWLLRFNPIAKAAEAIKAVSTERVYSPKLLVLASLLAIAIFLLDAGTLWVMMKVVGISIGFPVVFVTIVIASIAGTVSFLPGGIGGFEAGSVAILTLLGVSVEAALAGTLLLRGFTLWLPLIPGMLLARRDVKYKI